MDLLSIRTLGMRSLGSARPTPECLSILDIATSASASAAINHFVTDYERGQKRIDAVELVQIAEAIGFDPAEAINVVKRARKQ